MSVDVNSMVKDVQYGKTLRKSFAKMEEIEDMPNLLEIQKKSYQWFLDDGLREVFRDVAAITDYSGNLELTFLDYSMTDSPKYTIEECQARDATYAAPLKVRVCLRNRETEEIKEQEIFMGDFPIMTPGGTFVINGAERVIVSQIIRSPGMYYDKKTDKTLTTVYSATSIPYRGAWLEYETDTQDVFSVRIDKNRKIPVSWLLKAINARWEDRPWSHSAILDSLDRFANEDEQLKEIFGPDERILATLERDRETKRDSDKEPCMNRDKALLAIYSRLRPGDPPTVESAETLLFNLFFDPRRYDLGNVGRYKFNKKLALAKRIQNGVLARPAVDPRTGEVLADEGEVLTAEKAEALERSGLN